MTTKTIYRINCIWCERFLKNLRAKEKMDLACIKCGNNFFIKQKYPNEFDIEVTIQVEPDVSAKDFYGNTPRPEKEYLFLSEEEIRMFPLHCIFCRQRLNGKKPGHNTIDSDYTCNPCKNTYHVSFLTKEKNKP